MSVCGSSRASAANCVASRRGSAAVPVERPVGLGVQLAALEDDEPRVDALPPQRLHVLPRNPGDVDRAVRDPQLWTIRHRFRTVSAATWIAR